MATPLPFTSPTPSSDARNTRIGSKHNSIGDGSRRNVVRRFIGFNNTELDQLNAILTERLKKVFSGNV